MTESSMTTLPPTTLGREEALKWFLKVIDGAGGEVRSYDGRGDATNVFCGDFEPIDTWNWAKERGLIETSFDSMAETSTARITEAGRTFLSTLSAQHEADRARIGELEAGLRPFAETGAALEAKPKDDACWAGQTPAPPITFGHLRRARALLNPEQSR